MNVMDDDGEFSMKITLIPCGTIQVRPSFGHHLGSMYLASVAREWTNFVSKIEILDMRTRQMTIPEVIDELKKDPPDVVGLSAKTCEAEVAKALSIQIRKLNPNALIVTGGAHPSAAPYSMFDHSEIDAAVIGEGEKTFVELLTRLHEGKSPAGTAGALVRADGELIMGEPRPYIEDIDSIPFPAWDLIDISLFESLESASFFLAEKRYMSMFTSRACPFSCIYCHQIFGKKFRPRSPENVLAEIDILYNNYGIRELHIQDDVFNFDKQRVKDICNGILDRGYKLWISFPDGLRGDILDQETIDMLKRVGTYYVGFGVETASPRIQKLIRKQQDLNHLRHVASMCDKAGFITCGFFMLGFPTETREELEMTVDYAVSTPFTRLEVSQVAVFPGTKLYDWAKEVYKDLDVDSELGRFMTTNSLYQQATGIDLSKIMRRINVRFYLNPVRMWKLFRRVPRKIFLFKGLVIFIKLLIPSFLQRREKKLKEIT
jgi:radical SAM superfamily enzyme YgiQ (UPF0313 family)